DWARYAETPPGGAPGGQTAGGFGDFGGFRVHVGRDADLGDFSEFFRTFFGDLGRRGAADPDAGFEEVPFGRGRRGGRGVRWAQRGDDLETTVEISLEEAAQGSRRTLELEGAEPCATCGGTGKSGDAVCPTCQGRGQVTERRRVDVRIPAGVRDGSRVRVAGSGGAGSGGAERGDLFLRVRVTPHPLFTRQDDDVQIELPVAAWEAALRAEVQVPTR